MPQPTDKAAASQLRRPQPLLSSCAMGLALAAMAHGGPARAQVDAMQGTGQVVAGSASINNEGGTLTAPRTNVQMDSSVAVINWTPSDSAPGSDPIDFLPANGTVEFRSFSDPDFTVLNRVEALTNRPVGLNGAVSGIYDTSGIESAAGNIWFYSPTGIVAGASANFSAGGIVLTANDIPFTAGPSGGIDYGPDGQIRFASAPGSQAGVVMLPGSQITTSGNDAYTLLVAPSIVQGGTIETDGSVGLVAAEQVSITIQNSLFDMDVEIGTSVVNALTHSGSTGLAVAGDTVSGAQKVVLLATPQNTAITMVLNGNLGATMASSDGADRAVILSGGYDYNDLTGPGLADASDSATPVNVQIGTSNYNADFTAVTTGSITASPARGETMAFAENAALTAGTGVTVTADLDEEISVGGDLLLRSAGASTALLRLGATNAEAGAGNDSAAVIIGGNLTVSASAVGLDPATTAEGGAASIVLDAGATDPTLTVESDIVVEANGIGFGAFIDGGGNDIVPVGGNGTGGNATFSMGSGTVSASNLVVQAGGLGGSGEITGGNASGGTAQFIASGGTATLGDIAISAEARGGAGGTTNGLVDNSGAVARLSVTGVSTRIDAGNTMVAADAVGSAGPGVAGPIEAGLADIRVGAGGTFVGSSGLEGSADATWFSIESPPPVSASQTRGGNVLVTVDGGTIEVPFGQFAASAGGPFTAGPIGDALGGFISITASDTGEGEGIANFSSGLVAFADAFAGGGLSGGSGQGGTISLHANGGTIAAGEVSLIADGRAGFAEEGQSAGIGGNIDIMTSAGGAAAGFSFGSLFIAANGNADSMDLFSFNAQAAADGVEGQGGSVNISVLGGSLDGGSVSTGVSGGGTNGQGGTFSLLIDGGTVAVTSLDVDATGTGSPPGTGPDEAPGNGFGGSASIQAVSGTFLSDSVTLDATGYGGIGDSYYDQMGGAHAGGAGQGGSATLTLGGATFAAGTVGLLADGIGGDGAFFEGSPGGSGTGGTAAFAATDAQAYSFGELVIRADGTAGNSTGTVTPLDGTGAGGTASFVNQGTQAAMPDSRTINTLIVSATGSGGMIGGSDGQNAVPGLVQFSEFASGANGRAAIGSAQLTAGGLSAPAGTGALIETAGGTLTIGDSFQVDSAGTVTINVTGDASILTSGSAQIASGFGDVVINHIGQSSSPFATITGDSLLIDAAESITAGPDTLITTSETLTLRARAGSIAAGNLIAGDEIGVHALNDVALTSAATTGSVTVLPDGTIAGGLIDITAGVEVIERAGPYQPADITLAGTISASGEVRARAGRDILGAGSQQSLSGESVLLIAERDIAAPNLSVISRRDINVLATRDFIVGGLDTPGAINMVDAQGTTTLAGQLDMPGTLAIGSLTLRGPTPGLFRAGGDLTIGQAVATGLDVTSVGGTATIGGLQSLANGPSGFLRASGLAISLNAISATGDIVAAATGGGLDAGDLAAEGAIELIASANVGVQGARAGGPVMITSQTGMADVSGVEGSRVSILAAGDADIGTVTATSSDILVTAGGSIGLQDGAAATGLSLDAGTSVTIGNARAGGALTSVSPGTLTIETLATGSTIRASSGDIAIGGAARVGTPGSTALIELTNSDPGKRSYYGGADTTAGYSLNSGEAGRLFADGILLSAPRTASSSAATPDVVVGDMTITGRATDANGQLGQDGAFTIQTSGIVQIGGAVSFTDMAAGNAFAVRAGDLIVLDNQSGLVDLRGPNDTLAGAIDLSARTIMAVSQAAQQEIAGLTDPAAINALLGANDGPVNDQGVLRAGQMRFTVADGLYIQNTGAGTAFAQRRGFTAGTEGIAVTTPQSGAAQLIVINGQVAPSGTGNAVTGLDTIGLVRINGELAASSSGSAEGSTINGCDFANAAGCTPAPAPIPAVTPSQISPTREIIEDPVNPLTGTGAEATGDKPGLISMEVGIDDVGRLGYEPLIDEPVTGSGNDDLWMRDCDPGQPGGCPQPAAAGDTPD